MLPTLCLICRRWCSIGLCTECVGRWGPGPDLWPRCPGCGQRLAPGVTRCADCCRSPGAHAGAVVAVDYAYPWDHLVAGFKFGGQVNGARALGHLLARAVAAAEDPSWHGVTLIPIPLSPPRLRARGYNQAALLARQVAARLGLALEPGLLLRPVDLPGQALSAREDRLQRLAGVFSVNPGRLHQVRGRRVAVVDDVWTTGATAAEATRVLLAAGAAEVRIWALARTPPPLDEAS